jgi:flavin reductase (DIM6/NTAB) family NADH-FMN oxidoreductase RutF
MADEKHVIESNYVGMVSANIVPDKLERAGFHTIKSENVDAPIIEELPLILECKLESYDEKTDIMIAEIINVSADESILMDGKIDPAKLSPITLEPVNSAYLKLGEKVGNAFKDGTRLK